LATDQVDASLFDEGSFGSGEYSQGGGVITASESRDSGFTDVTTGCEEIITQTVTATTESVKVRECFFL
jgi:hypothetical protein